MILILPSSLVGRRSAMDIGHWLFIATGCYLVHGTIRWCTAPLSFFSVRICVVVMYICVDMITFSLRSLTFTSIAFQSLVRPLHRHIGVGAFFFAPLVDGTVGLEAVRREHNGDDEMMIDE